MPDDHGGLVAGADAQYAGSGETQAKASSKEHKIDDLNKQIAKLIDEREKLLATP